MSKLSPHGTLVPGTFYSVYAVGVNSSTSEICLNCFVEIRDVPSGC